MNKLKNIGNQIVSGALGFELVVRPGQRIVYLPDLEVIRNKTIKHIDVCDELTNVLSETPLLSPKNITLTLRRKNTQVNIIERLPLTELSTSLRNGNRLCFNDVFDIPASYIELDNNTLEHDAVIYFVAWFDEPYAAGVIDESAKREISYFELPLTGRRTFFPEDRTLFRKKFQSLFLSFPEITAENRAGIDKSLSYKSFLSLQRINTQFMQAVPLYLFYQVDKAYMLDLQNIMFDFTNSFIDIAKLDTDSDLKTVFFNCVVVN